MGGDRRIVKRRVVPSDVKLLYSFTRGKLQVLLIDMIISLSRILGIGYAIGEANFCLR